MPGCNGRSSALVAFAVVEIVRVAVPTPEPVILTGVVVPKLKVGRYCALAGLEARAAVNTTFPVKPPLGVTVMAEVFATVAPAVTETAVPLTVKESTTGGACGVADASFDTTEVPMLFTEATS